MSACVQNPCSFHFILSVYSVTILCPHHISAHPTEACRLRRSRSLKHHRCQWIHSHRIEDHLRPQTDQAVPRKPTPGSQSRQRPPTPTKCKMHLLPWGPKLRAEAGFSWGWCADSRRLLSVKCTHSMKHSLFTLLTVPWLACRMRCRSRSWSSFYRAGYYPRASGPLIQGIPKAHNLT